MFTDFLYFCLGQVQTMKLKKIFRHSYVSVLFVMGLAISCFVLINVSELVGNMLQDYLQLHEYGFEKCISLSGSNPDASSGDEAKAVQTVLECTQEITVGNVYASFPVEINKSLNQYEIRVFLKDNEETGLSYTALTDAGNKEGALIGKSMTSQLSKDSEGCYLQLYGVRLAVSGVLDENMAGGTNRAIYVFWEDCSRELRDKLLYKMGRNYTLFYGSHEDAAKEYMQFLNSLISAGFDVFEFEPLYSGDVENVWYEIYQGFFLPLCLFFSICNCLIVSHVWFLYRKQEIGIRKAYGYGDGQILFLFGKDLVRLALAGVIIAILMQLVYGYFTGTSLMEQQLWGKIGMVFLGMAGLILMNLVFILCKLRKLQLRKIIIE